ncbi:MAG: reverse transcriptase domain-containing protein [Arsenophonus sp. NC-XBC3-MAG3]
MFKTVFFADDQIVIRKTEDKLQKAVYTLQKLCGNYNFKISTNKTKNMAIQGKNTVRTKIVVNYTIYWSKSRVVNT